MENKDKEFGQISELNEIIKIGLNGDKILPEVNELLNDFAKSNPDESYRLETQVRYQEERSILEFKLGEQTVRSLALYGSEPEPHLGIEFKGQDINGQPSSVLLEPLQKFVLETVINK